MANVNKVIVVGRLTRDPELKTFAGGSTKVNIGFCVNNRKKNSQTGQWEDDPCFLDLEAWNRGSYKLAEIIANGLTKGQQAYFEGKLKLDQWTDQEGGKRQKLKIVVDEFQFLEPKRQEEGGNGYDEGAYDPPPRQQQRRRQQNDGGRVAGVPF